MSIMKLEYAEDIYDIPYEEDRNGLLNPKFRNYGRKDMTPLERKAVDMMNEMDPTALDLVNMSGLYLRIWKEIGRKAESARNRTTRTLMKKAQLSQTYTESAQQRTEIDIAAQEAAWDSIRTSVTWLAEEVRSRGQLMKIKDIRLSMMTKK